MFDTIVNARASKTRLELAVNGLNALRVSSFPANAPATVPSSAPSLRVTIDGNNRSETLLLGEPSKPAGKESAPNETEFYAQLMTGNVVRPPVFTVAVPNQLLGWMRDAQTELRERRLLDVDASAITSITLAAPNQPPITLQRLDSTAPDSPWQLARGGGNNASATVAADTTAVRHLVDALTLLSAKSFASDAPTSAQIEAWGFNRPEREITITTAPAPGAAVRPILLQLGTDSNGAVYARVGTQNEPGSSVYAVTLNLGSELPTDPNAWRDRTVRTLPAAARISSLKITDLANGAIVYETAFDADGKPATDARDPAALQQLLAALRNLRATRFVGDHFTDHVLAGGEERAWRFAIDYAVNLPGAAGEQNNNARLEFTERVGGSQQFAGAKDLDLVFEPDQPLIDALWALTYGAKDPGAQAEKK